MWCSFNRKVGNQQTEANPNHNRYKEGAGKINKQNKSNDDEVNKQKSTYTKLSKFK